MAAVLCIPNSGEAAPVSEGYGSNLLVKYMLSAERVKASLNEAIGSIPSLQEAKSKSGVSSFDEKWRSLKESVSELRQLERSLSKAERKNFGLVRSVSDCIAQLQLRQLVSGFRNTAAIDSLLSTSKPIAKLLIPSRLSSRPSYP